MIKISLKKVPYAYFYAISVFAIISLVSTHKEERREGREKNRIVIAYNRDNSYQLGS